MKEGTKGHVLNIIAQLTVQYNKIYRLGRDEAMQDYRNAVEAGDVDAKIKALDEAECYMKACAEVRKAIKILRDVFWRASNDGVFQRRGDQQYSDTDTAV